MIAAPALEIGAPTWSWSTLPNIIRESTSGASDIDSEFSVGEFEIAASGVALKTEPCGARQVNAASEPLDTGRSWNA